MRSIEAGIFNDAIKSRMEELDAQKTALKRAMADKELARGFRLTKEHILTFLERMKKLDYKDRQCQRRLVDTFVNSIFVYDDYFKITFNFGGDSNTITLKDLKDVEAGEGFVRCVSVPALALTYKLSFMWFLNVFAVDVKIPEN